MNRIDSNRQALIRAITKAGSQLAFARSLRDKDGKPLNQSTVGTWLGRGGGQIDPEYCAQVEHLYGVTCEELRSDLDWRREPTGTGWFKRALPIPTQQAA